jgi:hypothetical protein
MQVCFKKHARRQNGLMFFLQHGEIRGVSLYGNWIVFAVVIMEMANNKNAPEALKALGAISC